jgi:upstream activation factor subunit UAF30
MPKGKKKAVPEGPSDDELKKKIRELLPKVNLQKTGVKAFMSLLSSECGDIDLKPRNAFIKKSLEEAINEMADSDDDDDSSDESSHGDKKPAAGRGLSVKKELSPELAEFLGKGEEMARTEVVKLLWNYIKENDLQNPDNKREIMLDDKMKEVFGVDTFTMFTMNKYVAAHIYPFKPVDLTPKEKPTKGAGKKRKSSGTSKDSPKKKRKPKKPGLQPPYRLSGELAEVVGKDVLPRPQVVSAIWEYIKNNGLQVCACTVYCSDFLVFEYHLTIVVFICFHSRILRINEKSFVMAN